MAKPKREKHIGAYAANDVKLSRPKNVDSIGNVIAPKRALPTGDASFSGGSMSRPVTKGKVERYGP